MRNRHVSLPLVLEPAHPDLGVGTAMNAALPTVPIAQRPVVTQVAVVTEREPASWIVEGLRVGSSQGGQARRSSEMDERGGRFDFPDPLASRVVAEGSDIAVRGEALVTFDPGRAPAKAGDPVPLEALGGRPQLVESERLLPA